jgi:hypothetical protein
MKCRALALDTAWRSWQVYLCSRLSEAAERETAQTVLMQVDAEWRDKEIITGIVPLFVDWFHNFDNLHSASELKNWNCCILCSYHSVVVQLIVTLLSSSTTANNTTQPRENFINWDGVIIVNCSEQEKQTINWMIVFFDKLRNRRGNSEQMLMRW